MTKPILTPRPSTRPSAPPGAAPHPCRRGAVGFTLIELMVSIAIMAIIALAFGGLLTQANKVVTEGEKRMRADAAASAISRIIRGDINKITKNGFFRVSGNTLVLVTAGKTQSSFADCTGDGAIIVYGRDTASSVLYRKVLVLSKDAPDGVADCLRWNNAGVSLAKLQVMGETDMGNLLNQAAQAPGNMKYPPETLSQVTAMWVVLAGNCTGLDIKCRKSGEDSWGDASCNRHAPAEWPDMIKFKFTLKARTLMSAAIADDELSDDDVSYEIICPVGH